jgi:hypothetical protein
MSRYPNSWPVLGHRERTSNTSTGGFPGFLFTWCQHLMPAFAGCFQLWALFTVTLTNTASSKTIPRMTPVQVHAGICACCGKVRSGQPHPAGEC